MGFLRELFPMSQATGLTSARSNLVEKLPMVREFDTSEQ